MKKILVAVFCILSTDAIAGNVGVSDDEKASEFFKRTFEQHKPIPNAFVDNEGVRPDFTLEGELGVLNTTGNTDTSLYKIAIDAEHDLPQWFNQYSLQALHQLTNVDGDEIDNSRLQISIEFDYKLSTIKNRLFMLAEYDDNQFLALRDQITGAFGWRHLWLDSDTITFGYSIGPGYSYFRQEPSGKSFEGAVLRASADFSYTFANEARIRQEIVSEINESATKVNAITSTSAKIFDDIALKFSFEITKDENVASNVDELSTQTSISLVYQFF